jgi:Uma2 family endonuclease
MRTVGLISVEEYLSTSYSPDCEYVSGAVVERNVGEKDHGKLQRAVIIWFHEHRRELRAHVFPEQRIRVAADRFRVPDVCVVLGQEPVEQVFTAPPFICIEILSPEDRLAAMQEKVQDFIRMGVPHVWIINPRSREAFRCTADGLHRVTELRTEEPEIRIPLDELFAE